MSGEACVRTSGQFLGLCRNCENGGRMACKRLARPANAENIMRWCLDVPYGSDRARPPKPADESSPAASPAEAPRFIAGASVFVRSCELARRAFVFAVDNAYLARREAEGNAA